MIKALICNYLIQNSFHWALLYKSAIWFIANLALPGPKTHQAASDDLMQRLSF